ncbi:Hypoxia up-regulated protein 1 [Perkinsus chesapeaki]|uniref:Hypoxia up-regulated protein 1 n=1 Tax=Perkinsus chesapeaki TaxID=330153 RepID=A0A7J6MHI1_PERCH|nr:Hypoxia up-regulated protein 1 [Perkinsus chesapeaki]
MSVSSLKRPRFLLCLALALLQCTVLAGANILGIDIGNQYFKVAVVKRGKFEIVHNLHSKRKTPTAISFAEEVRAYGDDAVAQFAKKPEQVPMYFLSLLGGNFSSENNVTIGLPKNYYPYKLGYDSDGRKAAAFTSITPDTSSLAPSEAGESKEDEEDFGTGMASEEVTGHLLAFARHLAEISDEDHTSSKGKGKVARAAHSTEAVITVIPIRYRQAVLDAAEIAGFTRATLVHETTAAAVQRAVDVKFDNTDSLLTLFVNIGAMQTEVCVVRYTKHTAPGNVTVPHVHVQGCAHTGEVAGHRIDLLIADRMAETFCEKNRKLCEGFKKSTRASAKLLKAANNAKHVLSANKEMLFQIESLYEDTDLKAPLTRSELDEMIDKAGMEKALQDTIQEALVNSNISSMSEVTEAEVIGGGWRVPRLHKVVADIVTPAELGQHLNGEEAIAFGAAMIGANSSKSFRVRKMWLTDTNSEHEYKVALSPLNPDSVKGSVDGLGPDWERVQLLASKGHKLTWKKAVKLHVPFDVKLSVFEDDNLLETLDITGIEEAVPKQEAKRKEIVEAAMAADPSVELPALADIPTVELKFESYSSGILRLNKAQAIFETLRNQTIKPKVAAKVAAKDSTAATNTTETATEEEAAAGKQPTWKMVKNKVFVPLTSKVESVGYPKPMNEDEIAKAVRRRKALDKRDQRVKDTESARNDFEAYIYSSRERLGGDDELVNKVTTENNRDDIMKTLAASEDWLYEDGFDAQLEEYKKRLDDLKKDVVPVLFRADEVELREDLPEWVSKRLGSIRHTLDNVLANRTWVANETVWKIGNDTDEFESWFKEQQEKQMKAPLTEAPVYKVLDVKKRLAAIGKAANQLMKIRKPVEQPKKKDDMFQPEKLREIIRNITRDNATYDASKLDKMSSQELLTEYLSLMDVNKKADEDTKKAEGSEGTEAPKEEEGAAEGKGEATKKEKEDPHDEL